MSPRAKLIIALVATLVVGGASYGLSASVWGFSGSYSIVRMYLDTQSFSEAQGTYRLVTSAPVSEPRFGEIIVPKETYEECSEGDEVSFNGVAFGLVGTEAIDFKVTRAGSTQVEWQEGGLYFWVSLVLVAVLAGLIAWAAVSIIVSMMGLNKAPE